MRVLQALFDGGGNVAPQLGIARELVGRGHEVRCLGPRSQQRRIEAVGARFEPFERAPEGDASSPETDLIRDWEARTPIGAFGRVRDNVMFGPAALFAHDVVAALDREPADVVAYDYMLAGVGIGAEARGVPAVALVHTVYPLPVAGVPPFGQGLMPAKGVAGRLRDRVLTWGLRRAFAPGLRPANAARAELGLRPLPDVFSLIESMPLVLVLTSPELDFAGTAELPANVRYAGAVVEDAANGWDSPWSAGDDRPLVLASFSTTFQDQGDLAARASEALGRLPVRALVTTGPAIDPGSLPGASSVEVRRFVPHAAVMREAALVVCHAGLGTVHSALRAGVPLVCMPDGRDQNDNAARVVAAGAGARLSRRASAERIRAAVAAALDDPRLAAAAARLSRSFARPGAEVAADEIEALAG